MQPLNFILATFLVSSASISATPMQFVVPMSACENPGSSKEGDICPMNVTLDTGFTEVNVADCDETQPDQLEVTPEIFHLPEIVYFDPSLSPSSDSEASNSSLLQKRSPIGKTLKDGAIDQSKILDKARFHSEIHYKLLLSTPDFPAEKNLLLKGSEVHDEKAKKWWKKEIAYNSKVPKHAALEALRYVGTNGEIKLQKVPQYNAWTKVANDIESGRLVEGIYKVKDGKTDQGKIDVSVQKRSFDSKAYDECDDHVAEYFDEGGEVDQDDRQQYPAWSEVMPSNLGDLEDGEEDGDDDQLQKRSPRGETVKNGEVQPEEINARVRTYEALVRDAAEDVRFARLQGSPGGLAKHEKALKRMEKRHAKWLRKQAAVAHHNGDLAREETKYYTDENDNPIIGLEDHYNAWVKLANLKDGVQ